MLEYYVNEMIKEDIVFVTASGNDDREEVAVCVALVLSARSTINSYNICRTGKHLHSMSIHIRH